MRIRAFVFVVLTSVSFTALAENYIVSQAYEIAVAELRLPASDDGSVTFRDCGTCIIQTIRVTPETRYLLNGRYLSLAKFRREVARIVDQRKNIATVIHHLESDLIVEIQVFK